VRPTSTGHDAERLRRLLACLGDPSRFELTRALLGGERCVTDLARSVGLSQSCTTRHLQSLAREGLVRTRRDGKRVLCRLRPEGATVELLAMMGHSGSTEAAAPPANGSARDGRRVAAARRAARREAEIVTGIVTEAAPAHDFGAGAGEPPPSDAGNSAPGQSRSNVSFDNDMDDYLL